MLAISLPDSGVHQPCTQLSQHAATASAPPHPCVDAGAAHRHGHTHYINLCVPPANTHKYSCTYIYIIYMSSPLTLRLVDLGEALGAHGPQLDLVVDVVVQVAEPVEHPRVRVPHSPVAGLNQPPQDILEGLRVALPQPLCHLLIKSIRLCTLVIDPLLLKLCGRAPAYQCGHALGYLEGSPGALGHHRVGPLGVEQFGAVLEAEGVVELLGARVA
mmetsp:Transcript_30910/g.72245  ORF Transcript_30910/g.72245 Transcript_30910/m.72245 type:complete len:216 (-) Transcript_30910:1073-1720(-)